MKRVLKVITAIILVSAIFLLLGQMFDISDAQVGKIILLGNLSIIAAGLMDSRRAKNQKRYQELYERTGSHPSGFIRKPSRIQAQAILLMIVLLLLLGLTIVASFLCYQDGALNGEVLLYIKICFGLLIATILLVGVLINKLKQEIGYNKDGVILYKNQGEQLSWREFGICEKRGKQVSFYSRNGDKLFLANVTDEGYAEFWKLYQMNVEGLMPQKH